MPEYISIGGNDESGAGSFVSENFASWWVFISNWQKCAFCVFTCEL
jgi:hypothetical protein